MGQLRTTLRISITCFDEAGIHPTDQSYPIETEILARKVTSMSQSQKCPALCVAVGHAWINDVCLFWQPYYLATQAKMRCLKISIPLLGKIPTVSSGVSMDHDGACSTTSHRYLPAEIVQTTEAAFDNSLYETKSRYRILLCITWVEDGRSRNRQLLAG